MEKHEKNSVDIDSVSKKIDNYIKNNMSKETISEQEIRSALLEKYLMLSIANNEYIARDYVISIEESFSIYNRNEETKKLSSLKNKINKNIKKFIDNIRSSKKISKNVIDVKDLELYLSNNKHNVYDMEISGTRVYVYIDNKNNQYEIVSLNNDKYTFESKNSLLDYINNNNNNNKSDESIKITAIAYKNKDFIKLTKKIEVWSINENTLINEVYENIKLKKTVKVNDDFSIKLVEQYDYKTIFIVKDNGNNNEHIVNIYSDDIKEAISIIIDSYSKINNNPESMIYEKNNKWYVKKKTTSGIAFAQGKDLITPVANILERINMVAGDYVNKLSDDLFGGFCYGLSLKYLMEVRNNGYENAENYLKWLKDTVILYKNKNKYSSDKVGGFKEKIQRAILEYELMELTNEVKNIIIAHNYQQERIKGLKYTYNTSDNTVPFSDILKKSGLVGIGNEQTLLNEKMFFEKIDELLTGSDNRYIFVGYKQHQTAITYKKYSDGKYKVTFFEPRFGIFEYDNIEDLKKIIKEKQKIYGLNKHGNELKYGYDEFLEVESQNYKSLFSNKIEKKDSRVFRNKNLADNLKSIDFSLEFSKEVTGRIMHYDEDGILIVQIKHNDRLIELRVIEKVVEDGLFLIKDNIDEIIKSQDVSKIILKKKNNSVEVIPIEFNTVIAEKKTVGYVLFDKNEYIFIKNEPYHGLTDENKKTFDKVKLLINDLDSNIYFEKIKSSIEIIGAISKIIKSNKQVPIIEKLKNIKMALEKKLFHGELKNEKDKIITLSEKNIDIATKLYQVMANEINTGSIKESQFIYDNIIQNKLLNSKVTIPVGIKGYDYTITIETNSNLKDIIHKIDINQLKNMIYYDGKDKLHLRVTYDEIMIFQRNDNIKKLLNILDGKIKEYKTTDTKSNNEIFIENFANHDYVNRVLQLEFNELSNLSYTERSHYNNDNEVMVDYYTDLSKKYDNPSHFIKTVLSENKGKKGVSYILFNSNIENLNFINANHSILINNTITKIVTDLIPKIYQYDLNNYLKEIKHNGIITNLLKENEVLKKLVDMCTKSKISIIAAGESDLKGIHNKYISKNIANENLYNSITDNTLIGENILIIADKDKIYNYRNENIHIEGLADRLNIPIFNVIEGSIKVLPNKIISDGSLPLNPYTEIGNNTIIRGEVEAETEYTRVINIKNKKISKEFYNNIVYSNKIYKKISKLYPLFRNDERFLLGYKNNIESVIPNYSKEMKNKEILDYIELNKYNISKEQLGAIIREIDSRIYQSEFKSKYSDKFTKLFYTISNNNGTDKAASLILFPQQQLLLNLKNGAEGRCESLTMLMLVAKYLEHGGDFGRGKALINNLLSAQSMINRDTYTYIDPDVRRSSEKLISSINEL
ncbi:hypothetical protein, partial [Proteus myxofaciens]|uniref:hypothetical protein n=1 Tax=Proteus myxofaciens TaxID=184072 RepID=UPI0012EED9D4